MTDRYLRTGIFLAPFHALDENPTLAIERDMELLEHLDRLNYHEAWIGEHHSGGFEIIACPEMFIAAAAERTRHIRLGTGVVSLPYHNPFMLAVAHDAARPHDARPRHVRRRPGRAGPRRRQDRHRARRPARARMNESLDVIMRADAAARSVDRKTDWFDLDDAQLQLPSYTPADDGDGGGLRRARRSARVRLGQARHRHAVDRRHLGRRAEGACQQLGRSTTEQRAGRTARRPTARSGASSPSPTSRETREQAREDVKFGLDRLRPVFHRRRHLPDPAARHHRCRPSS